MQKASADHEAVHKGRGGSNPQPLCMEAGCVPTVVLVCGTTYDVGEIWLIIERTDYRSNLAKTILFDNCSCFSKIPFSISVESPRIF